MTAFGPLPEGYPLQRPGVWLRRAGPEAIILDTSGEHVHALNPTAMAVWELCDGTTASVEMADAMAMLFGADPVRVLEEVERVLAEFSLLGLLDWVEGARP